MEEKELSLEGILYHLTSGTIKEMIAELTSAIDDKFLVEFKPGNEIVTARDAAIAYMKRAWPNEWEE